MPEITVASTTDAQTAIDHAAGVTAEDEKPEVPEGEEPETKPDSESEEPEKPSKSAVQKRIDKLTREKHEARAEAEDLKKKLLEAQRGGKPQPEEKPKTEEVKAAAKPKPDDFPTYEDFVEALADWKADQKLHKIEAEKAENAAKQAQKSAADAATDKWNAQIDEAKERYDDFEDVVGKSSLIPDQVAFAITRMENGTDVAYYLGKHPEVCKKLMKMGNDGDLLLAIAEAGKISGDLMPTEEREEDGETVPKVTTRAKTPPRPVAGSSTRSTVPVDELPYNEYRRIRDKQEKERYRR